jgi:hypothetical protein
VSRKRKRDHTARFVGLPHYMLKSAAWRTMPPNAKAVLIDVWQRHNGSNNGEISYAVREAEGIGLSKDQAGRALDICEERGFLVCTRESAFTVKTKAARLWRITAEKYRNEPATMDFMRWSEPAASLTSATVKSKTQSHQCDTSNIPREERPNGAEIVPFDVHTVAASGGTSFSRSNASK